MRIGAAVFIVILLLAAGVIWRWRMQAPPFSADDLQQEMRQAAAEAVTVAKSTYGVTLDYSPTSVEAVESILSRLHEEHRQAPFPLSREKEEGWRWGAYIGEVILRVSPGRWEVDHPVGGQRSYPVRVARGDSFPTGWCRKRILHGPEDNVWHKFQILYLKEGADPAGAMAVGGTSKEGSGEP